MKLREQLLTATDAYCQHVGIKRTWLSTKIFNDGKRLDSIAERGRDIYTGTFEAAMSWLSENWPEGADWPDAVPRPDGKDARPGEGSGAAEISVSA